MIKFIYKDNNIYLDKYVVIKDVKPKNEDEETILKASIIQANNGLMKAFKNYKIVNFENKKNFFYIEMYNKKHNIKRVENFCIWLYENEVIIC